MLHPFNLNRTVSRAVSTDPDDILKLKTTLSGLGHYRVPKWGITPYPDSGLFDAVEDFQKQSKLKVDGVLKPGGPTQKTINQTINQVLDEPRTLQNDISKTSPYILANANYNDEDKPPTMDKGEGKTKTQVAGAPLIPLMIGGARVIAPHVPKIARELSLLFGAAKAAKELNDEAKNKSENNTVNNEGANKRTSITKPLPPTPPFEPKKVPEAKDREELIPEKIDEQKMPEPIPVPNRPGIFIFPIPDIPIDDGMLDRNETEETKKEIDALRDREINGPDGWKHAFGGRDQETGDGMKEYRIPGHGQAFPLPGRKTGDGRKRSAYTDLTFVSPDGRHFRHYQHADVDRNGKPTRRELENAERIRRALNGKTNEKGEREYHDIILVPKKWQIRKKR